MWAARLGLDWDDARIMLALARAGTLSAAATQLGLGVATVARRIERLEKAIGVPLFLRHQTGYRLTDQGTALLPRAEAIELAVSGLERAAGAEATISGHVRVASIESIVAPILMPALGALMRQHPRLEVEILISSAMVNLNRRDADIAIRMVRPDHGAVRVRHLANMGFGLYGAKNLIETRGPNAMGPEDRLISWPDTDALSVVHEWNRAIAQQIVPRLTVSTLAGQVAAVAEGLGLAILPHFLARPAGLILVTDLLPDGHKMSRPLWQVVHADLAGSGRVRAVADCLAEALIAARGDLAD